MKPITIVFVAFAVLLPAFSTVAQDYEDDETDPESKLEPEGRILGAAPAFGLGLLGGTVASSLIRGVGNLIGLRSQAGLRPAMPAAFYPAPVYIPGGYPFPPFPGFPSRSTFGPGRPGEGGDTRKPYVPSIPPYGVIGPGVGFVRSEDEGFLRSEDQNQESEPVGTGTDYGDYETFSNL